MKTIKIIDILCYISIGDFEKLPKKIKFKNNIYEYRGDDYSCIFQNSKELWLFSDGYTNKTMWLGEFLNHEVEILDSSDEFEDIVVLVERLCLDHDEITPIERATRNQVNENRNMITQLIKNQKKIIETIKKEGK